MSQHESGAHPPPPPLCHPHPTSQQLLLALLLLPLALLQQHFLARRKSYRKCAHMDPSVFYWLIKSVRQHSHASSCARFVATINVMPFFKWFPSKCAGAKHDAGSLVVSANWVLMHVWVCTSRKRLVSRARVCSALMQVSRWNPWKAVLWFLFSSDLTRV